jgi:hypothetical protein
MLADFMFGCKVGGVLGVITAVLCFARMSQLESDSKDLHAMLEEELRMLEEEGREF